MCPLQKANPINLLFGSSFSLFLFFSFPLFCLSFTNREFKGNRLTSVGNDAFHGLTALSTLDLRDNGIRNISDSAFTSLTALNQL